MVGRFLATSTWAVRLLIVLVVVLMVIAVVGPEIRESGYAIDYEQRDLGPSASHPLGTDPQGRDYAFRVVDGLRSTIVFGLASAALWAGLCLAVGLLGRQLRRFSRWRPANLALDVVVAAAPLAIAIPLCLDWLDPDAGSFQQAGATSSPGFERLVMTLTLYESAVVLFVGLGMALGIWISRTSLPMVRRLRWGVVGIFVLAALAVRAEPHLAHVSVSPVEPPSASIGVLIDQAARYSSTGWGMRVLLAVLWVAAMTAFLGCAVVLASRHLSMPTPRASRIPIYLVAVGWVIAFTALIWRLTPRPVDEWAYWVATALAGAGLAWCAVLLLRGWREPLGRGVYIAAIACAVPLALDWPLAKALDFAIPRLFF